MSKAGIFTRATMAALAGAVGIGGALLALGAPAGADTPSANAIQLGGYDLTASASGLSVFYEQPNFPIPATPSLEMNLGYANSTFDSGPVATGNGSAFWPGPIIANGGGQLPLLLNPYLQKYAPSLQSTVDPLLPTNLTYPVDALSAYPQGPPTATNNDGPMAMTSSSAATDASASSSVGIVGGSAAQSALPAGMLSIQAIGSSVDDGLNAAGDAVSTATSTIHGLSIGGGLIQIGAITSTATSTSDGNTDTLTGGSTISNASILGEPITVGPNGITVLNKNQSLLGSLLPSVNSVLQTLGITISLNNPTDVLNGAAGHRRIDGLQVNIDFTTFDQAYSKLYASLPASLTSALDQLPIPTPYKQDLTLDLGWVDVNAAASPAFNVDLGGLGDLGGSLSTSPGSLLPAGSITSLGTLPGGSSTTSNPSASSVVPKTLGASSPVSLFKGLGGGLIALLLLLAIGVMAGLLGADRAVGTMAAAPACIDEEKPDLI